MSLGIPAIVSPVGVNTKIVASGRTGFVADSGKDWEDAINKLLTDPQLRREFGVAARKKMEETYSVKATLKCFLKLFD